MTCLTLPALPGMWQDFGWDIDQPREVTQKSVAEWSNGRVILLHQTLAISPLGLTYGRGEHYCSKCGSILSSMLTPELLHECPACPTHTQTPSRVKYWSHWSYWRFADSPETADKPGRVYLFSIPDQPDALKFGFSYDPSKRAKGSLLYDQLLWQSPLTTRAIARTVELDLHQSVKGGLFADPKLTIDQSNEAGATETFLLRPGWSLETIICHLEGTFNQVTELGWREYWCKYLPGIDGAPTNKASDF